MLTVRTAQRPVRLGLLVRQGSLKALYRAIAINTCLWGGIYNPIIPVSRNKRYTEDLINCFDPDLLWPVLGDKYSKDCFKAHSEIAWPGLTHLIRDADSKRPTPWLLDVRPFLLSMEQIDVEKGRWVVPQAEKGTWVERYYNVLAGVLDESDLVPGTMRSQLRHTSSASTVIVSLSAPMHLGVTHSMWPIHITGLELERYHILHSGWQSPGVFLGGVDDFDDMVTFWNLRAAGINVVLCPLQGVAMFQPLARQFMDGLSKRGLSGSSEPSVWYRRATEKEREQDITSIGRGVTKRPIDEGVWNGLNVGPVRAARPWRTVPLSDSRTTTRGRRVLVQLADSAVSRDLLEGGNESQWVMVDVVGRPDWGEESAYTLTVPAVRGLNKWMGRKVGGEPNGVRCKAGYVSVFAAGEKELLEITMVPAREIVRGLLQCRGLAVRESQPGRACDRILELIGGLDEARVLKLPGVRKLLRDAARRRGVPAKVALTTLEDRVNGESRTGKLRLFLPGGTRADPMSVLQHLATKGIIRPGLLVKCVKCGTHVWVAILRMPSVATCHCCGWKQGMVGMLGTSIPLNYRTTPLWRRADVRYGVVPVVLALWRWREWAKLGEFQYVPSSLIRGKGVNCEVDFMVLLPEARLGRGNVRAPVVVVGECKSTYDPRKAKVRQKIRQLSKVYDAIESRMSAACLVFATTRDTFDDLLLGHVRRLVEQGRRVILLGGEELNPYSVPVDGLPHKYGTTVDELAENSVAKYLPDLWKAQREALPKTKYTRLKTKDR